MQSPAAANSIACGSEDYRWLVGPEAAELLSAVAASPRSLTSQVAQLRRHCSPERTRLVLETVALRQRGRAKFAAADRMFFTSRGLEQATDEVVAEYKARRLAHLGRAFDLCCGIGGDLLALARRGDVVGFDSDPIMALVAAANASILRDEVGRAHDATRELAVSTKDVRQLDVTECAAWHIDPDRRPRGRRTTRVELHEPGPEAIEALLARNPHAAIKLAPAAEMPASWTERAELEWISRGRECRQLVAWFGNLARNPAQHRATVLPASPLPPGEGRVREPRTIVGLPGDGPPPTAKIGRYLFEPDAAVLAAKLGGTLAAEHGLLAIAPGIAYWTGDQPLNDAAIACFEVCEVLPFRVQPLKALLTSRGVGQLEIKKRGVEHDPEQIRRQLSLSGEASATLLITRIERRVTAIVARRVTEIG